MGKNENESQLAQQYIEEIKKILKSYPNQKNEIANQYKKSVLELKIPELSSFFLIEFHEYLDIETYCQLEYNVINQGNLELALELTQKIKIKNSMYALEQKIIDSKDANCVYSFLINNNTPHKKDIIDHLKNEKSLEFNCKYVQYVLYDPINIICLKLQEKSENYELKDYNDIDFDKIISEISLDVKEHEKTVLKSENVKVIYEVGLSVLESLSEETKDVVITLKSKYKKYEYKLNKRTVNSKIINIEKYIEAIIKSKNSYYIYSILKRAQEKNINISKYKKDIIQLLIPQLIYRMASLLNAQQNTDLENAILNSDDIIMIYIYAKNIQKTDIKLFTKKIIELGNYEVMIKYAKNVLNKRKEDISDIQDVILKSGRTEIITKFAHEVVGIDIKKCFDAISKTKNIDAICQFAAQVPELDERILSVLIEYKNNAKWSSTFMKYFPFIDNKIHNQIVGNDTQQDQTLIVQKPKPQQSKYKETKFEKPINDDTMPQDLDNIWAYGNIDWIIEFAKKFPETRDEISIRIIAKGNPKWSWEFIQRFRTDSEEHKKIIDGTPYQKKYEKLYGKEKNTNNQKKQMRRTTR